MRGGRKVDLLSIVSEGAKQAASLETVLMYTEEENGRSDWPENFFELTPEINQASTVSGRFFQY